MYVASVFEKSWGSQLGDILGSGSPWFFPHFLFCIGRGLFFEPCPTRCFYEPERLICASALINRKLYNLADKDLILDAI